jgi:hypothetical protein
VATFGSSGRLALCAPKGETVKKALGMLAAANVVLLAVTGLSVSLLIANPATAATPRLQVTTGTIEYLTSGYTCGTTGTSGLGLDVVTGLGGFGSDTVITGVNSFGSDLVRDVRVSSWSDSLTVSRGGLNKSSLDKETLKACKATVVTRVSLR